jgi:hypothetical protein
MNTNLTWRSSVAILIVGLVVVAAELYVQSKIDELWREVESRYARALTND